MTRLRDCLVTCDTSRWARLMAVGGHLRPSGRKSPHAASKPPPPAASKPPAAHALVQQVPRLEGVLVRHVVQQPGLHHRVAERGGRRLVGRVAAGDEPADSVGAGEALAVGAQAVGPAEVLSFQCDFKA
jgi:hypothetical protein